MGDKKNIEVLRYQTNYAYGGKIQLDTNATDYIKITDKSEERHNTSLELELIEKDSEDLYIRFIDPSVNYIVSINLIINPIEATSISMGDLTFIS